MCASISMCRTGLFIATVLFGLALPLCAMTVEERHEYLKSLRDILPEVPSWNAWLEKSGELPPNF